MGLSKDDIAAIHGTAKRLGLDPHSLGGLMQLESGIDPNIWGGAGGKYRGLIQFGPDARKEVGLPDGPMTVQQQLPYVEKYFQQRGYKPGDNPSDNITRAYRTVLVGNPWDSGTDSFGTNSDKAARRMMPGGDLYKIAAQKLGVAAPQAAAPAPSAAQALPPSPQTGGPPAAPPGQSSPLGLLGLEDGFNQLTSNLQRQAAAVDAQTNRMRQRRRFAAEPGFLQQVMQLVRPVFGASGF